MDNKKDIITQVIDEALEEECNRDKFKMVLNNLFYVRQTLLMFRDAHAMGQATWNIDHDWCFTNSLIYVEACLNLLYGIDCDTL